MCDFLLVINSNLSLILHRLATNNKKFELMLTRRVKAYSMSMPICNRFHERLANNSKITTFTGVPLFDALVRRFS